MEKSHQNTSFPKKVRTKRKKTLKYLIEKPKEILKCIRNEYIDIYTASKTDDKITKEIQDEIKYKVSRNKKLKK